MLILFRKIFYITYALWILQAHSADVTQLKPCEGPSQSPSHSDDSDREQSLIMSLTREQWLEDLAALDSYIRCAHVHPFLKKDEAGYLKLLGQTQVYLSTSNTLDKYIINGHFEKLVSYISDGHAYIAKKAVRFGSLPYRLEWFANKLYVVAVEKIDEELLGAEVLGINNQNIESLNDILTPFLPVVNSSSFKLQSKDVYHLPGLLYAAGIIKTANEITLNLKTKNGKSLDRQYKVNDAKQNLITFAEAKGIRLSLYHQHKEKNQWFIYLKKQKALYIRYALVIEKNKGDMQHLTARIDQLLKTKAIKKVIIDVRNNPGGDSYFNAPLINILARNNHINQQGKLFVLTNANTFSAAINFVGNMEVKTEALFVGEKVGDAATFAGEVGPEALHQLPNSKMLVSLSFSEWNTTYDEDTRDAPALDIPVTLGVEDFISGKDPVLQAALDYTAPKEVNPYTPLSYAEWTGRYNYSADKALRIFEQNKELHMEITELAFSRLYPVNNSEYETHMSGVKLQRLENGDLELIQVGSPNRVLTKLVDDQLKPLELLIAGDFNKAKAAYAQIYKDNPELLSIRGNSLGILATHLRAKYPNQTLYQQLRDIAESLHGAHIFSWDLYE